MSDGAVGLDRDALAYGALAAVIAAGPILYGSALGPALGVVAVAMAATLAMRRVADDDRSLWILLVVAFLARWGLVVLDVGLGLFPKADAIQYHFRAATLAQAWRSGVPWQNMHSLEALAYEVVVSPLFFWFGSAEILARTFNAVLGTFAVFNVFRIGREVFDRRRGLVGAGIFALTPSVVRIHGEHLREAWIALLLTEVVYLLVAETFDRPLGLGLLAASMGVMFYLRRPTFLMLLVPLVLVGLTRLWRGSAVADDPLASRQVQVGVAAVAAGGVVVAAIAVLRPGLLYQDLLTPRSLTAFRAGWARGGSQYLSEVTFRTWWDVAAFLPVGALYFLFTPFPWQVNNALALAALAENLLILYPATLLALLSLKSVRKARHGTALVAFLVVSALVYGLIEGNVGTALRHKAQFTWVIFLLAGATLARVWDAVSGSRGRAVPASPEATEGSP